MDIDERILSDFTKIAFSFERFVPQFIKSFLNRKLKEAKKKSVITDRGVKVGRKGKGRYIFEVDLHLNLRR